MDENNFISFMEFLKFLETEDLKGANTGNAMKSLVSAQSGFTAGQRGALAREFPAIELSGIPGQPFRADQPDY